MAGPLDDQPDRAIARRASARRGPVEEYRRPVRPGDLDEDPQPADLERFSGVTMTCPACGAELYDDVAVCWQCASPVGPGAPRRSGGIPWVALVAGAVILALVLTALL